ncbi:hypothetical protein [Methylobacterium sp. J-076]|uniref:hypothetical protein n=1 Tax=Methylobacterium sp. J-076 TaxID=2836655 RepID=UPI001FBABC3A|nr:hypothetical protein [Methylobacterium sp. J-076]MCJ2013042.1 hypothetical protein [Methylobacterium sp. J-076]
MRPGHFALALAVAWVTLFAFYLMFAGSVSLNEAGTGAAAATLACIWWAFGGRRGGMRFSGWPSALGPLWRATVGLPAATAKVAGQLARAAIRGAPPGTVDYERDADSAWATAEAPAERALGLIAASLAPDSYVLREKGGDAGIVTHSLAPQEARP